jgi:hypothetical protein
LKWLSWRLKINNSAFLTSVTLSEPRSWRLFSHTYILSCTQNWPLSRSCTLQKSCPLYAVCPKAPPTFCPQFTTHAYMCENKHIISVSATGLSKSFKHMHYFKGVTFPPVTWQYCNLKPPPVTIHCCQFALQSLLLQCL